MYFSDTVQICAAGKPHIVIVGTEVLKERGVENERRQCFGFIQDASVAEDHAVAAPSAHLQAPVTIHCPGLPGHDSPIAGNNLDIVSVKIWLKMAQKLAVVEIIIIDRQNVLVRKINEGVD